MKNRNNAIDFSRLVLAFFVVCIHVPFIFGSELLPVFELAVPLFYAITGFYMYSESYQDLRKKLIRWIWHWLRIYIIAFIIIFTLLCVVRLEKGENISQIIEWATSRRVISLEYYWPDGKVQLVGGILWFLLAGIKAFIVFLIISKFMNCKAIPILFLALYVYACYKHIDKQFSSTLTQAIPYMYVGYIIHQYKAGLVKLGVKTKLLFLVLTLMIYYAARLNNILAIVYLTRPIIIAIIFTFLVFVSPSINYKLKKITLDPKISMDIYLFHPSVYFLLTLSGGDKILMPIQAVIVYTICLITSYVIRVKLSNIKFASNNDV